MPTRLEHVLGTALLSILLIDTHNDLPYAMLEKARDISVNSGQGHTDIPRLRAGGVGAVFFAAYVPAAYAKKPAGAAASRTRQVIDVIRNRIVNAHPDTFVLAGSAADVEAAQREGKIAALIGIEGGHAIEDRIDLLDEFYASGARYMTLTHTNTNHWADSAGDMDKRGVRHHNGLTELGRRIVTEMNRLGMMVDISHVSDKTFEDALAVSRAPVFASHSSCRAVANHPRNMTDDMIRAMARKGGVIQINFSCDYVSQRYLDALRRNPKAKNIPRATLADVVAQIDHAVQVGGIDAVGIGSDFDGITCTPEGLDDVSKFPELTRALMAKGYTEEQIARIYGGNTLRLMRDVERVAASMRSGQ